MPGYDGTGPRGQGPRTGGGFGWCPPGAGPVYGAGRGGIPRGGGRGRAWGGGRGWGWRGAYAPPSTGYAPYGAPGYAPYGPGPNREEELRYLDGQASMMEEELNGIRSRIDELRKEENKS